MLLDDAALDHLADLARLELDDAERGALRADLERLLDYLAHLQSVDVTGVAPMSRPATLDEVAPSGEDAAAAAPPPGLRSDAVEDGRRLSIEALEALAPGWSEGRFRVARTVDDAG
jgi:aspartyl-tRNA(Asn)/glutamyl-tRNA(Gln) amidotransferase subunit C